MRAISVLAIVFLSTLALFSQARSADGQDAERSIESIRTRYNDIAEKARLCETDDDRGQSGDLFMNELVVNKRDHQWRAVGIYGQTYRFFYTGGDSERHLYPDRLVLVKAHRKVSARKYYEEFLFSDRGELIFYFQKAENDDETAQETRLYLKTSKMLRVIEDGKKRDYPTAKDATAAKQIIDRAREIRAIFDRSIKL